jgi:hypothetical protein
MALMNVNFGTYVCTTLSIDVKGVSMCECTYKCVFINVSILKQLWFGYMCVSFCIKFSKFNYLYYFKICFVITLESELHPWVEVVVGHEHGSCSMGMSTNQ